ncbi:hypothetical protein [Kutzneria chonburiensis]|uniref:Uncharacterized protein n=1 Tax=Kutzneria chonburiensis TaxID=1483604 RepID=A0ABV6N6H8_9PSEU|nr:hypothetical protein [Kutzneria chonburiensis]
MTDDGSKTKPTGTTTHSDGGVWPDGDDGKATMDPADRGKDFAGLDWKSIEALVLGGGALPKGQGADTVTYVDPQTLVNSAAVLRSAYLNLHMVARSIADQTNALAGEDGSWKGPAAARFRVMMLNLSHKVDAVANVIVDAKNGHDVPEQLLDLGGWLVWAQNELRNIDYFYAKQIWDLGSEYRLDGNRAFISKKPEVVEMMTNDMRKVGDQLATHYYDHFVLPGFSNPKALPEPTPEPPGGGDKGGKGGDKYDANVPKPQPQPTPFHYAPPNLKNNPDYKPGPPPGDHKTDPPPKYQTDPPPHYKTDPPPGYQGGPPPVNQQQPPAIQHYNPNSGPENKNLHGPDKLNDPDNLLHYKSSPPPGNTGGPPVTPVPLTLGPGPATGGGDNLKLPNRNLGPGPGTGGGNNLKYPNRDFGPGPGTGGGENLKSPGGGDIRSPHISDPPGGTDHLHDNALNPTQLPPGLQNNNTRGGGGTPFMPPNGMGGSGLQNPPVADRPDSSGLLGGVEHAWTGNTPDNLGDPRVHGETPPQSPNSWGMPFMPPGGMGGSGMQNPPVAERPDSAGLLGGEHLAWTGEQPDGVGDPESTGATPAGIWAGPEPIMGLYESDLPNLPAAVETVKQQQLLPGWPATPPAGRTEPEEPEMNWVAEDVRVPVVRPTGAEDMSAWDVGAAEFFSGLMPLSVTEEITTDIVERSDEPWGGTYHRMRVGESLSEPLPSCGGDDYEPDESEVDEAVEDRAVADLLRQDDTAWGGAKSSLGVLE